MRPSLLLAAAALLVPVAMITAGARPVTSATLTAVHGQIQARPPSANSAQGASAANLPIGLAEASALSRQPVPDTLTVSAIVTLPERHSASLSALLAKGYGLSPGQWSATYGPAPAVAEEVRRALARAGISSYWEPGEAELRATGPAVAVEAFFRVRVDDFVLRNGVTFYAALGRPSVPRAIAAGVREVTGMDDYPSYMPPAVLGSDGVTPSQMSSFYDIAPLRRAGIDGTGVTVMFPEDAIPDAASLRAYARKFHLPPFHLTIVTNPAWGQPVTASNPIYWNYEGEATMDVEIVHGLAPGAREVVYEGISSFAPAMFQAMVTAHPTAVFSGSYYGNECEQEPDANSNTMAWEAVFTQAAAEGMSIFWASGDRGAYACLNSGYSLLANENQLSLAPDGTGPYVTSVGGTTVFLASNGAYYKETAWGEPMEQWGGGGGFSSYFARPSWQQGPGTEGTERGVPDVSADADPNSGWDVILRIQGKTSPQELSSGGTSASAPCWAAITALVDQYLKSRHLATVGFANPALYLFAAGPKGLAAVPFHPVTEGSNLYYQAQPGWNPATGLGSPDVAHLADDFAWYDRARPRAA